MNRYEWALAGLIICTIIAGALVNEYRGAPLDAEMIITHNDPLPLSPDAPITDVFPDTQLPPAQEELALIARINRFSLSEIKALPGVGDVIAQRVQQALPIERLDDLLDVEGIGAHRLENIELHLRSLPTQAPTPVPTMRTQPQPPAAPADSRPVNLNTATRAQLMEVSGIGPALADIILQERMNRANRGFRTWSEVDQIPGIGPARLNALRNHFVLPN